MKDYGNAGALCGALGCMVLLIVSMHFAKAEDKPKTEKVSAEVVFDEKENAKTSTVSSAVSTEENTNSLLTTTSVLSNDNEMISTSISDISDNTVQQPTTASITPEFIGPLTVDMRTILENSIEYSPEVLHMAYPENLSIVGDSIASGFGVYGILDNPYDFATGNLAARSITDYGFNYGGNTGKYIDVLTAAQPAYIYLSMGMNDVNIITSDEYAELYRGIITNVHEACPNSVIIVAGITPISAASTFTANSTILIFNEKLKAVVEEFASPIICYYDAGSFITDPATGALREDCDGGDGIHLSQQAYSSLLENLYLMLDEIPVPQSVKDYIEENGLAMETTTSEALSGTGEETITETVSVEIQ